MRKVLALCIGLIMLFSACTNPVMDTQPSARYTGVVGMYPFELTTSPGGTAEVFGNHADGYTIYAESFRGYEVRDWIIDGVSMGAYDSFSFRDLANYPSKIHIIFEAIPCPYDEYEDGKVYHGGDYVCVDGFHYRAKWWTQNERPPGTSGAWELIGPCTHVQYVYIHVNAAPGGILSGTNPIKVIKGSDYTVDFVPDYGYELADATANGVSVPTVGNSVPLTNIQNNINLDVSFVQTIPQYVVTASTGPNGIITPAGSVIVNAGETVTFDITPDPGYQIDNVLVDGVSVGAITSYTFQNIQDNHSIEAQFAIGGPYHLFNATAGPNGSINPSGSIWVPDRGSETFIITANPGFQIQNILVDGIAVLPAGTIATEYSYTFENVVMTHTIEATFTEASIQEWMPHTAYQLGDEVVFNEAVYVCEYAHTSLPGWEPGIVWFWNLK